MKRSILFACGMLLAMQNSFSVEAGFYYCLPVHAAHLIKMDDGSVTELRIDISGAVQLIVIDNDSIDISGSLFEGSRLVDIISNEENGPVHGRSQTRQFYMDDILHYFYGSTDASNSVAYAEDGMCSRFTH